jgi:hypothetical protein
VLSGKPKDYFMSLLQRYEINIVFSIPSLTDMCSTFVKRTLETGHKASEKKLTQDLEDKLAAGGRLCPTCGLAYFGEGVVQSTAVRIASQRDSKGPAKGKKKKKGKGKEEAAQQQDKPIKENKYCSFACFAAKEGHLEGLLITAERHKALLEEKVRKEEEERKKREQAAQRGRGRGGRGSQGGGRGRGKRGGRGKRR